MLSCKEVSRLLSRGQDRPLGFTEGVRLRVHLAICDGCTAFSNRLAFLRKAMARLPDDATRNDSAKP
jgi:hypothetical protein